MVKLEQHPETDIRGYTSLVTLENSVDYDVLTDHGRRTWKRPLLAKMAVYLGLVEDSQPQRYPYVMAVSNAELRQSATWMYETSMIQPEEPEVQAIRETIHAYLQSLVVTQPETAPAPPVQPDIATAS